jgi:hypothetical protein
MLREDGTDPSGHGAGTEREKGKNAMGRFGIGWEGYCICPQCGEKTSHQLGIPCINIRCINCGTHMMRE